MTALLLSTWLLQVAVYYFASAVVNGPGPLAFAQGDALLYCQAARRIVEGFPFSFSFGTAVSTGTTSVLYPFVLAIPCSFGFVGPSLMTAGFLVNAIFYLIFLGGWSFAFRHWFPEKIAAYGAVLLALFPQTAYCALAQSDVGLWMAVSGVLAAGLSSGRLSVYALPLVIGPWVRPEGMLVVVAFALLSVLRRNRRDMLLALVALASVAGVFAFNGWLTGTGGFSSVANKGYFTRYPFATAVIMTGGDLADVVRNVFFGLTPTLPRSCYFVPVLGVAGLCAGLLVRKWSFRADWSLLLLALAAVAGVLVVAQSGWQGTNYDRYLAWLMPLPVAFSAAGWHWFSLRVRQPAAGRCVRAVPVVCSIGACVVSAATFNACCEENNVQAEFVRDIDRLLPPKASVGAGRAAGMAYFLGNRRFAHLSGIYSPEFRTSDDLGVVEILKNERATRFDYWVVAGNDEIAAALKDVMGGVVLTSPDGRCVREADWSAFDRAADVPDCGGKRLVARVDLGYEADERRADYGQVMRCAARPFRSFVTVGSLAGKRIVDVGRVVLGEDFMTVGSLTPGRDLYLVMRTVSQVSARTDGYGGAAKSVDCAFSDELDMHVSVDGRIVACGHVHPAPEGFSDVTIKVPGEFVTANSHRLGLHGDHASFGYWFYQ